MPWKATKAYYSLSVTSRYSRAQYLIRSQEITGAVGKQDMRYFTDLASAGEAIYLSLLFMKMPPTLASRNTISSSFWALHTSCAGSELRKESGHDCNCAVHGEKSSFSWSLHANWCIAWWSDHTVSHWQPRVSQIFWTLRCDGRNLRCCWKFMSLAFHLRKTQLNCQVRIHWSFAMLSCCTKAIILTVLVNCIFNQQTTSWGIWYRVSQRRWALHSTRHTFHYFENEQSDMKFACNACEKELPVKIPTHCELLTKSTCQVQIT